MLQHSCSEAPMTDMKPDSSAIEACMLHLITERGEGKSICPSEVARSLGGDHPDAWGPLMQPVRRVAVKLAHEGRMLILRKGKPVDPADFRGVYRLSALRID